MTSLTSSSSSTLRLRELLGDREYLLHLGDDGNERYSCFVSVRDVPAYMIPRDILNYFGGSLHEIKAFHIYQHVEDVETYAAIIEMTSRETANTLINDYSGQQFSSLEGTICDVAKVMGAELWEDGSNGKGDKEEQQAADDGSGRMFLQEWYDVVHAYTCPLCLDPIISTHSASPSPSPTPTPSAHLRGCHRECLLLHSQEGIWHPRPRHHHWCHQLRHHHNRGGTSLRVVGITSI